MSEVAFAAGSSGEPRTCLADVTVVAGSRRTMFSARRAESFRCAALRHVPVAVGARYQPMGAIMIASRASWARAAWCRLASGM